MKSKIVSLFLLTVILTLVVVSAATFSFTATPPAVLTKSNTQTSFIITNRGPETVNFEVTLPVTISDGKGHEITLSSLSPLTYNNLAPNQNTGAINIIYSGDTTNFKIGEFSSNIVIKGTDAANSTNTLTQTLPIKFLNTFCASGENATSLSISSVNIDNADGDDTTWNPLDEITVKVEVENSGTEKITSINVELGLIDSSNGKNIIKEMDSLDSKKISLGSISEDKQKTAEFKFQVPVNFKDGDYNLIVKAYKSGKEAEICSSSSSDLESTYYQVVSGERETDTNKQVILNKIIVSPETSAQCGEKVQISGEVVNIGDEDYQDQIKVTLINKELGLNLEKVIREDLDQGDSLSVDFEFDVPANVTEKTYTLKADIYYDYDDSDNTYDINSDSPSTILLKVAGNCKPIVPVQSLQISAELAAETPDAVAGKQVIVKATLRNTGDSSATYSLSLSGNSGWSSLVSIDPQTLTLNKGESKDVSISLNVDKEAEGDKDFTITANSGTNSVNQKVALTITKPQTGANLSRVTDHIKRNWFIYVIVIVNVILLIAILIVIRGMFSSSKKEF